MKKKLFATLLTFVTWGLIGSLVFSEPLKPLSAASSKNYISDVIVVRDNQVKEATDNGYTILDSNAFYSLTNDANRVGTKIGYKTTKDPNEAIKDLKLMNMNGGWSFSEYDNYLDSLIDEAEMMAANLYPAITYYRNIVKDPNSKQGIYAKQLLNCYYDDDVLDSNGKPMRLGDIFASDTLIADSNSTILSTLFLESNIRVLDGIYNALQISNSLDSSGNSFIDNLDTIDFYEYEDATIFNPYVSLLKSEAEDLRKALDYYYSDEVEQYEDFESIDDVNNYIFILTAADKANGTDNATLWTDANAAITLFSQIPYSSFTDDSVETLLDMVRYEDAEDKDWYPLVASMNEGLRPLISAGLYKLVNNTLLDPEDYPIDLLDPNNLTDDYKEVLNEGISVFEGIDRELYQKGHVAMTVTAIEGNAMDDNSWTDKANTSVNKSKENLYKYLSIGFGAFAGVGLGVAAGGIGTRAVAIGASAMAINNDIASATKLLNGSIMPICNVPKVGEQISGRALGILLNNYNSWLKSAMSHGAESISLDEFVWANRVLTAHAEEVEVPTLSSRLAQATKEQFTAVGQSAGRTATIVMTWALVIAVIVLIVTLVLYFVERAKNKKQDYEYEKYTEIPSILCHRRSVYKGDGSSVVEEDPQYVYYYAAKNPYGVRSEALYGDSAEDKKLPDNPKNVQDIYDWSLFRGKRQWLVLYYTKDNKAGFPILEENFTLSNKNSLKTGQYVVPFNASADSNSYDISNLSNINLINTDKFIGGESGKSAKDYKIESRYLHFVSDTDVDYENWNNNKGSNMVASAISNGGSWVMAIIALGLGITGGFFINQLLLKKRKEE